MKAAVRSKAARGSRSGRKGSAIVEFALVGIPVIFFMISLFEAARGMWVYHTLAYAVREGTRCAAMHGSGCASPNTCQVTIGQITTILKSAGIGLDQATTTATFTPANGSAVSGTLASLASNTTVFPPAAANAPGQVVQISLVYPFRSILSFFWVRPTGRGVQTFNLGASSAETVQF
jgi:Flp pilus assembly protein TadG